MEQQFVNTWFDFEDDPEAQMDLAAGFIHNFDDKQFTKVLKMIDDGRKDRLAKTYQYLVTFTIDPAKHPDSGQELEDKIEQYISNIPHRPALRLNKCAYVRELHKSGKPHWHVKLQTKKPLRSDAFKVYQNNFGNVDISRSKHTNDESHIDFYLNKENTMKTLL